MSDRGNSPTRLSTRSRGSMSRPTSLRIPNPDPFGDDYAVDGSPDVSPVDSIQNSHEDLTLPFSQPRTSYVPSPSTYAHFSRPTSTAKRLPQDGISIPHRAVSSVSRAESTTHRTSSTSSRFSMPRPQSPYIGSTAPSHPYAMYPQVTRASSIASESTVRPFERPFVAPAGPEHPYAMYPQNTVSGDEDLVPVGFPGMGTNYQTRAAGHDIAHLIGSDGHIEELPPYSRYADNVVPKSSSEAPVPSVLPSSSPMSQNSDSGVEMNVGAARHADDVNEKRGWKSKAQKRICSGPPLWALILIIAVVILAASLGGVIGGVVGNDRATDNAAASARATTTVYLDGVPAPTYTPAPSSLPEGTFLVPIANNPKVANTSQCIANTTLGNAWGCLSPGTSIGINVCWTAGEGPITAQVTFEDYSKIPPNFTFGPQLPNLTSKAYTLGAYIDRDDLDMGVAMFFWTFYTKVSILPEWSFGGSGMRSLSYSEVFARDVSYMGGTAWIGMDVWQCSFDNSIFEFFLYPNETSSEAAAITSTASPLSSATNTPTMSSPTTSYSVSNQQLSTSCSETGAPSAWPTGSYPTPSYGQRKRDTIIQRSPSDYPRSIKMLEKRKTGNNPPGVCVKSRVQSDWSLLPLEDVAPIEVETNDFPDPAPSSGSSRMRRRSDDIDTLQSNCACEYVNF